MEVYIYMYSCPEDRVYIHNEKERRERYNFVFYLRLDRAVGTKGEKDKSPLCFISSLDHASWGPYKKDKYFRCNKSIVACGEVH